MPGHFHINSPRRLSVRSIFVAHFANAKLKIPLTPAACGRKSSHKVLVFPNSLYAQWRLESGTGGFQERTDSPPERLLQAIWQHQRLKRDALVSLDGKSIRVLHPGFVSREGGPDFRNAV